MKSYCLLVTLIILEFASQGSWAKAQCTEHDLDQLKNESLIFQDWEDLYKSYTKFGQCGNDGYISEGYSEAIVRLLADHWDKIDQLVSFSKQTKFKAFVLKHIDATTSDDDLKLIIHHVEAECTNRARTLCVEIGDQTKATIEIQRAGISNYEP